MSVYNAATGEGPFSTQVTCPRCGAKAHLSSHSHTLVDEDGRPVEIAPSLPASVWMPVGYGCTSCGLIFCNECKGDFDKMIMRVEGLTPSMAKVAHGKVVRRLVK